MSTPQPQPAQKLNFNVSDAQTKGFAQAWDSGGIKMILDTTSIRFATAWANIVLKSALSDPTVRLQIFNETLAQIKASKATQTPAATPEVPAPAPQKSSIILTD